MNFNIGKPGKMIKALEKSPSVRRIVWGILAVTALYITSPILLGIVERCL